MVTKPVIFISSTSDLRVARELVGKVLYSMGYEPVWQDIEATDGGELLQAAKPALDALFGRQDVPGILELGGDERLIGAVLFGFRWRHTA